MTHPTHVVGADTSTLVECGRSAPSQGNNVAEVPSTSLAVQISKDEAFMKLALIEVVAGMCIVARVFAFMGIWILYRVIRPSTHLKCRWAACWFRMVEWWHRVTT